MTLVARLQKTTGAAVIMAFAERLRAAPAIICICRPCLRTIWTKPRSTAR